MTILIQILIGFIALLHLYFFWFESFAWMSKGPKIFRHLPKELFPQTKAMMANQGLYNGFLAAGLLWTFLIEDPLWKSYIAFFFLGCVLVAGIVGAITVSMRIFWIQAFPAFISIILLFLSLS